MGEEDGHVREVETFLDSRKDLFELIQKNLFANFVVSRVMRRLGQPTRFTVFYLRANEVALQLPPAAAPAAATFGPSSEYTTEQNVIDRFEVVDQI